MRNEAQIEELQRQLGHQYYIGKWWGLTKLLLQHITPYIQYLILAFSGITAYGVIESWLVGVGIILPFWGFVVAVAVILIGAGIFEFKLSWASFFSIWNWQVWVHRNPMKDKLDIIDEKLDRKFADIDERLDRMERRRK